MIKKLLFTALVTGSLTMFSQSFSLVYTFSNVTSTTGVVDPTPPPTATGLTAGSFTANGLSANPTTTNVFAFTSWPTGATNANNTTFTGSVDPAKNFEVSLTPSGGYAITLNSITFYTTRSGTGPRHWVVRSSLDAFTANLPADVSLVVGSGTVVTVQGGDTFFWSDDAVTSSAWYNNCKINLGGTFANLTNPVNFRWHAYDAESGAGSWRIDSVGINGSASISTGLNTLTHDLNAKFKLYPNPSNDGVVTIETAGATPSKVEVINLLGAVVLSQNSKFEEKTKFNLGTLPEGTYFVRITTGNKVTSEKLIISK